MLTTLGCVGIPVGFWLDSLKLKTNYSLQKVKRYTTCHLRNWHLTGCNGNILFGKFVVSINFLRRTMIMIDESVVYATLYR